MAVQLPTLTQSFTILPETASRTILITRDVVDNGNGTVSVNYGGSITPKYIEYELDSNNNKIAIYDSKDIPSIDVPLTQLDELFSIKMTLADGTVTSLEEVLGNFADQIINTNQTTPGIITTQNINITNVLAAQNATTTTTTSS